MGAGWNAPGDVRTSFTGYRRGLAHSADYLIFISTAQYTTGTFDNCAGDSAEKPGVYSGSTFHQGDPSTREPHLPRSSPRVAFVDA